LTDSSTDRPPPSREELLQFYQIAVDEYRFQVNLNWNRTQYYLTLNVGIISIATGILQIAKGHVGDLTAGLYFAGLVCCCLSLAASSTQRRYYRSIRDHKANLETQLGLESLSIRTTSGMGGKTVAKLGKVTTLLNVVLVVLALMNIAGIVTVFFRK
jgi:hypothetical protein